LGSDSRNDYDLSEHESCAAQGDVSHRAPEAP
jgi:hypothetical protein